MNKTGISWTDYTWNPVSGCTKVSEGCKFCYAEALSKRWGRSFNVTLHPEKLKEVNKIPPGSKVFVNSMSDLFHEDVPDEFVNKVIKSMASRPDITFQILTKRPELMRIKFGNGSIDRMPENVWIGVSVELRKYLGRVEELVCMADNYSFRGASFISFEPLLEDIGPIKFDYLYAVDWIIIGGESGPHHRPMNIEWARNLVRQAKEYNVAVWMKQLGGLYPGGNLEDFPEDLRIREFPGETKMMEAAKL